MRKYKCIIVICLLLVFVMTINTTIVCADDTQYAGMKAFLDDTISRILDKHHIPNAAVTVVKDGKLVYKKGFGFADIEKNIPVDPDTTLFRIGSTSKLITWTAVMQLVEEGKLDLNTDINTYLDFEIPKKYVKSFGKTSVEPITITHLMTHTSGFEDYPDSLFRLSPEALLPLNEYVKKYLPSRIFPAGEVAAYSNYGTALAGYIVERISGLPYSDYAEKNIFRPLHMDKSTYRQNLNMGLSADIARPYRFINGAYTEGSFEYILPEPAGSMSTTASDMANFMAAHLNNGSLDGSRVLKEETSEEMHKQHFTHHPALGGMALGFMEGVFNNKHVLFHSGGTMLYSTGLYLLPEEKTGIFITYSGGNNLIHSEIFQEFMDYYHPVKALVIGAPGQDSGEGAKKYIGEYQMNRRAITTDEKINSILGGGIISVEVNEYGNLMVTNAGETNKFVEVEPGVYQNLREGRTQDYFGPFQKIVFLTDPYGRIMLVADGPMTYSKAPFYSTLSFTVLALLIILAVVTTSLIYWISTKIYHLLKRKKAIDSRLTSVAQWIGICTCISVLVFFAGILSTGDINPVYQLPEEAYMPAEGKSILDFSPIFTMLLGIPLLVFTVISWHRGLWGKLARVHYTLFSLTVLGLIWIYSYWNLLNSFID